MTGYRYTHVGSGQGSVGTEIIDNIATGPGAAGFTPPLGPDVVAGRRRRP